MTTRYTDTDLDIDADRWYYTKFSVSRYRKAVEWESVKETFDRTAEAVRALFEAYKSERVFGDAELTALKSTTLTSSAIGGDATQAQYFETDGSDEELERAANLVSDNTGIVGGIPYDASVKETSAETLLDIFEILLDEDADLETVDSAAMRLLDLDLDNIGGATLTALLCLLRPTRFPIINQQTEKVFDACFDIRLSASAEEYLDSTAQFHTVREEFGFDSHLRQLDYFCYWMRAEVSPENSPLPENFEDRTVWQINAGRSDVENSEPERLWPVWKELGICSIGWDTGPLDEFSAAELETAVEQWDGDEIGEFLRRFGKEMQPGQLIIAKDGSDILGVGVTKQGGYHYCPNVIDERIDGPDIEHVHAWPVEWEVVPDSEFDRDVDNWGLETGLSARKTLIGTEAFEGIRWQLAERDPDLIPALGAIENTVIEPPVATLPDDCRATEQSQGGCFILQTGDDKWEDDLTGQYHFKLGNPGTRLFYEAETADVVYLEDGEFYATARVTDIEREERDDEIHCFASIEDYEEIHPVAVNDIRGELETSFSLQHSIIEISDADLQTILDRGSKTRYFWINSASEDWFHPGGEAFYTRNTNAGTQRQNQSVYKRARPGDKILIYRNAPIQAIVGRGHVAEGLHDEVPNDEDEPAEGITLEWDESLDGVGWSRLQTVPELEDSSVVESDNSFVITQLTESEYERILELCEITRFDDFASELGVSDSEITVEQDGLHFPEDEWDRIQSRVEQALTNGNHVLLFGPPGTGKTKLARQVCEATVGESRYELVTASADWSTFDTVGGYQTTAQNTLEFEPGVVLDRFQSDGEGTPANEWLIIDELNRADIDKAFGSLFSALTGESVTLPFDDADGDPIEILDASRSHEEIGQNRFFIPEDWRMLATMNTLDKTSLYEMSYAFMRRWAFVPVGIPDLPEREDGDDSALESLVGDYVAVWAANGGLPEADHHYETVGRIWRAVNEQRAIGPAIVEDIYEHVASAPSTETADYVSPIIMYVFPQLEGLRRNELEQLIGALEAIVDDEADELWTVARDFFQIDLQPTEGTVTEDGEDD